MHSLKLGIGGAMITLLAAAADARAQGGTYISQGWAGVGQLSYPGQVGVTNNPIIGFGQVGGTRTLNSFTDARGYAGGRGGPDGRAAPYLALPTAFAGNDPYVSRNAYAGGPRLENRTAGTRTRLTRGQTMASTVELSSIGDRSAVGRYFGRGDLGNTFDQIRPLARTAMPAPTYFGPAIPPRSARELLDQYQYVRPRTHLAAIALGPRGLSRSPHSSEGEPTVPSPLGTGPAKFPDVPALLADSSESISVFEKADDGATPEQRLLQKVARTSAYFVERGDEQMAKKHYTDAKASYQHAQLVNPDWAAPYARLFLCSLVLDDFAHSALCLRRAIGRADRLDDLRINVSRCMPGRDDFNNVLRMAAEIAGREGANTLQLTAYAYLSWLRGDISVTRRVLEAGRAKADAIPELLRLSDLIDAKDLTPGPTSGGRT